MTRENLLSNNDTYNQDLLVLSANWFNNDDTLSVKGITFLTEVDTLFKKSKKLTTIEILGPLYKDKIQEYRNIFPKMMLPNGQPARAPIPEIQKKFEMFFQLYPQYTWDIIMMATQRYVSEYEAKQYMYMRTSAHFIWKQLPDKTVVYQLASYCDMIENNIENETEVYHHIPVI